MANAVGGNMKEQKKKRTKNVKNVKNPLKCSSKWTEKTPRDDVHSKYMGSEFIQIRNTINMGPSILKRHLQIHTEEKHIDDSFKSGGPLTISDRSHSMNG